MTLRSKVFIWVDFIYSLFVGFFILLPFLIYIPITGIGYSFMLSRFFSFVPYLIFVIQFSYGIMLLFKSFRKDAMFLIIASFLILFLGHTVYGLPKL